MRAIHYLNSALWLANAVVWAWHAHSPLMATISAFAAVGAFLIGRNSWSY